MRVGCGSAAIGMFAPQWKDHVDEVIVVDDHITGVLSEHQGGRFLDMKPAGIRVRGRKSTPGRYFQVAEPGLGWGGTNVSDPLEIIEKIDPKQAWPGLQAADGLDHRRAFGVVRARRGSEAAAGRDAGAGAPCRRAHRRELRAGALHRAVHGRRRRLAARRRDRESGAADALGARHADQGHAGRRAGLCLAGRRHHPDGRCGEDAGEVLRLRADAGAGGADRVHPARRRLCGAGRLRLARRHARGRAARPQGAARRGRT